LSDDGQDGAVSGGQPGVGLLVVADVVRRDAVGGRRQDERVPAGLADHRGAVPGVQVVVEVPALGGGSLGGGVVRLDQLLRVAAQQVVELVAAGRVLGEQVRLGQLGERPVRLRGRQAGETGGRGPPDVRARVQAEQPEQARGGRGQDAVRPGEGRPDVGRLELHGTAWM
jgi:hypothetical protein